jgi:hypothetical protein
MRLNLQWTRLGSCSKGGKEDPQAEEQAQEQETSLGEEACVCGSSPPGAFLGEPQVKKCGGLLNRIKEAW